ncbi:MAG: DUF2975 domain-containing protein [Sphingopyxis sp.]|uniref:DUF2975 domain-containing protein n=1 Tax=Sphingopyxis sp. TaxID=1908224 RepID=UPI003D810CCA
MLQWSRRLLVGLNIINWVLLILFMVAFVAVSVRPDVFIGAIDDAKPAINGGYMLDLFRVVMLLCIPIAIAAHAIFTRLVAMIDATKAGAAFSTENARRLRTIGWWLLFTQIVDAGFGLLSMEMSAASGEVFGWQPSLTAWLAVLLLFILARIFEQGAAMRDELEQTI